MNIYMTEAMHKYIKNTIAGNRVKYIKTHSHPYYYPCNMKNNIALTHMPQETTLPYW